MASHLCIVTYRTEDNLLLSIELSYIGHECNSIPDILSKSYGELAKRLDLSYNKINSLDGLERFAILEELILDNNEINDQVTFPINHQLTTLSLNKNKLKNLDLLLDKLTECYPNLTYISLLGNEACPNLLSGPENDEDDYQRYRYFLIFRMPKLKFLDSTPVKNKERVEANRVGVKQTDKKGMESGDKEYRPLPCGATKEGMHRGAYAQRKHAYSGKQSEGNRFIRNNDL
ncbi:Leucine-rich melanocyte differentiation-associated protein [Nymphon striatum]|nr:Leucine-rich melanocyte differentiation-associated protein [Nymphon striatum]